MIFLCLKKKTQIHHFVVNNLGDQIILTNTNSWNHCFKGPDEITKTKGDLQEKK